nr:hypothetical protein [Tanacetum cinerariifolium]
MTFATIYSGLVPNPPPSIPYVPPSRTDWIFFHPLFDEVLNPPPSVDLLAHEVIALISNVVALEPAASIGSPSSTTINQDAPSPSNSQTSPETLSPFISNDVEEENHDLDVGHIYKDPFLGISILENFSEASSSDVIPTVSKYALESLKTYGIESSDLVDTPMEEKSKLDEDPQGKVVDSTYYHGMKALDDALITPVDRLEFRKGNMSTVLRPPTGNEILSIIRDLGHTGDIHYLTDSKVPDEHQQKVYGTNEGASGRPEVLDLPKYDSESDDESWTYSQDEENVDDKTDVNDDSEETKSDNDEDDLSHPNLLTYKADDEEEEEEKVDDEEVSSDQRVSTPPGYELTDKEENSTTSMLTGNLALGPKRQKFYEYASNMKTSKDLYSIHKIIAITSLKIMKYFGYSHLEEIIVRRQDDQLYMFREGDFKRLRRQDIEDINRQMRINELHKFSDSTLNHVRTTLNDITTGIEMDYLPKRKWSKKYRQRARVMINAIDKKLKDRRLMRNLERILKDGGEVRPTQSDEVLKIKNFKKDALLKLFKLINQERYEHVGPKFTSSQDGKVTRWRKEIMLV